VLHQEWPAQAPRDLFRTVSFGRRRDFHRQGAQTGWRCIFVGAVGDDAFGQVVLDRLIEHGVVTSLIKVVTDVPTGTAVVSYNDDGSRDFVYNVALSAAAQMSRRSKRSAPSDSTSCTFRAPRSATPPWAPRSCAHAKRCIRRTSRFRSTPTRESGGDERRGHGRFGHRVRGPFDLRGSEPELFAFIPAGSEGRPRRFRGRPEDARHSRSTRAR
jgi:hypothetical protein